MKSKLVMLLGAMLAGLMLVNGCVAEQAKTGDAVKIQYTGKLEDGTVFDNTEGYGSLQFIIGGGYLLPAFEESVIGMRVGESKTIVIPADEAYGPYREEMVFDIDLTSLPEDVKPEVGQTLNLGMSSNAIITGVIIDVTASTVTVDTNHPLAGKDLTFDIYLLEIAPPHDKS